MKVPKSEIAGYVWMTGLALLPITFVLAWVLNSTLLGTICFLDFTFTACLTIVLIIAFVVQSDEMESHY